MVRPAESVRVTPVATARGCPTPLTVRSVPRFGVLIVGRLTPVASLGRYGSPHPAAGPGVVESESTRIVGVGPTAPARAGLNSMRAVEPAAMERSEPSEPKRAT